MSQVAAYGRKGWSFHSENVFFKTKEDVPGPVSALNSNSTSVSSLVIAWSPPSTPNGVITEYRVWFRQLKYKACAEQTIRDELHLVSNSSTATSVAVTGLKPYSEYEIVVQPFTSVSTGSEVNKARASTSTKESAPICVPKVAIITPEIIQSSTHKLETSATVIFFHIPCDCMNGEFVGFNYEIVKKSNDAIVQRGETTVSPFTITGLTPYTEYELRYKWKNSVGETDLSAPAPFTTDESVPSQVNAFDASEITEVSAMLTWHPPQSKYGEITKYQLSCKPEKTYSGKVLRAMPIIEKIILPATIISRRLTQLESFTQYTCKLSASTSVGEGAPAKLTFWTSGVVTVPLPIFDVKAQTDTTVTLLLESASRGSISSYQIVVKRKLTILKRDLQTHIDGGLKNYTEAKRLDRLQYIAAELPHPLPRRFTVGDGKMYGTYFNAPLRTGAEYIISIGIVYHDLNRKVIDITYMQMAQSVIVNNSNGNAAIIIGGAVAGLVFVIAIGLCLVRLRRNRAKTSVTNIRNPAYAGPATKSKEDAEENIYCETK
ncbi:phosphatidylinositol phosphatase PTPRQ-like isoform X2 [Tubulanus polymorphus]|uniref:phosphatidylinositol phosphatase PTPRQ-like isoform X2 n=1 Tax=Tubulanus polymorphus TaxID=672921 RepID=UPI003DA495DC